MSQAKNSASEQRPASGPFLMRVASKQYAIEGLIRYSLMACALLSIATTIAIILVLLINSIWAPGDEKAFFEVVSLREFLTGTEWTPNFDDKHFGVLPLLGGTFLIAGIAAIIGFPLGLASAIYLSEYASPRARSIIKPTLEVLAGIPTVVFGYFGLVFVTPYVLETPLEDWLDLVSVGPFSALSGGIVVGIMIVPVISSLSEDVLRAVPQTLREAAYALGSTKLDVSLRVVVPAALSGIVAAFLLAMARAVGETMAVTIAAGGLAQLTANPFDEVLTMTAYIANTVFGDTVSGSIEEKSIYAVGLTLFLCTLAMNILSQFVLRRFREVYH